MKYELMPTNGRKSFYGKAYVIKADDGTETLYSYGTPIIEQKGEVLTRLYDGVVNGKQVGFTATTMTHVRSFCGLNKNKFLELPLKER